MTRFFLDGTIEIPGIAGKTAIVEAIAKEERQKVICQYLPMVFKIAGKIWNKNLGHRYGQKEDLFQEGVTALIHAVDHYRSRQYEGATFFTYAHTCVYRHLIATIRSGDLIHTPPGGDSYSYEDELNQKFDTLIARAYRNARNTISISKLSLEDRSRDEKEYKESLEEVTSALHSLSARNQEIMTASLGLGGVKRTKREVAESLGISKQRVCQLESSAIKKLKNWLMERDPEAYESNVARSQIFTTNQIPAPVNNVAASVAPGIKFQDDQMVNGELERQIENGCT